MRLLDEIREDILALEKEGEGLLGGDYWRVADSAQCKGPFNMREKALYSKCSIYYREKL